MFNPNDHMMKLKGRDYLQVAWRLVWFREEHPDWSISTEALTIDEDHAIFRAVISDADGAQKSCGHGSESKRDFGDFIEKAETKAVGRALAMLGFGTQFTGPEFDEGDRIVDSPIDRGIKEEPPEDAIGAGTVYEAPKFDARKAISAWCDEHKITLAAFGAMRKNLIARGALTDVKSGDMTPEQYRELVNAVAREMVQKGAGQ